ncbi:MAG: type II secretion system GspH family protein [Ruminococcus sp.]|nr:type II secretion system GspH family protein [Ruminococcus sp.]
MKKTLKAFTLVELIVVMLIMTILLAGILQLFRPVRAAYQDAAYLENKRTVCNAISKYMTESLRYAQFIGTYDAVTTGSGNASDAGAKNAANKLIKEIHDDTSHGLTDAQIDKIAPYMQVICIDYSPVSYNNKDYTGRIYRYRFDGTAYSAGSNTYTAVSNSHMSFGEDYYGPNSYGVKVIYDGSMLTVAASTLGLYSSDSEVSDTNKIITSSTAVELRNITNPSAKGKLYFNELNGDPDDNGIPDMLEEALSGSSLGSLATGRFPYYFAFIPADKMPT